jgi:hypothetical protein
VRAAKRHGDPGGAGDGRGVPRRGGRPWLRPVTIARRTAAIAAAHRAQDHPNPCDSGAVAAVMSGIRRQLGTDQLRRALDVEDLEFDTAHGLKLTIRKSKTDQQQAGAQVAVPYARETDRCAVQRSANGCKPRRSTAGRCFAGCAAATPSAPNASPTSPSR